MSVHSNIAHGDVALPNGDSGTYGDVGEYALGELGL